VAIRLSGGERGVRYADHPGEAAQPIRSGRELHATRAIHERFARGRVFLAELTITLQSLNPAPPAAGRHGGSETASSLCALGTVAPVLLQNPFPAQDAYATSPAVLRRHLLYTTHVLSDELRELRMRHEFESGRPDELQGNRRRHTAFAPKEVPRSLGSEGLVADDGLECAHARPFLRPFHQVVLHRVREGVGHLVDHGAHVNQSDDTGLLGRPEVLGTPSQGVLTFREHFVKAFDELRKDAMPIIDARVVVIGVGDCEQNIDPMASGRLGETIDERVVRLAIRPHQKLALSAASSDHVRRTGQHLARKGHSPLVGATVCTVATNQPLPAKIDQPG